MLLLTVKDQYCFSRLHFGHGRFRCVFHNKITIICWFLLGFLVLLEGCSCSHNPNWSQDSSDSNSQAALNNKITSKAQEPEISDRANDHVQSSGKLTTDVDKSSANRSESSLSNQTVGSDNPSDESHSLAGSRSTSPPDGALANSSAPLLSPQQAQELAYRHLAKVRKAAQKKEYQNAFRDALVAWQAVRQHPDDSGCQALAAQAMELLEKYGESANANAHDGALEGPNRKPLKVE